MDLQTLKKQAETIRDQAPQGKKIFWPIELKKNAIKLMNNGHTANSISQATGISTGTIYSWKYSPKAKKEKSFKPIAIKSESSKNIYLSWQSGLSIDGLSFPELRLLLKEGLL